MTSPTAAIDAAWRASVGFAERLRVVDGLTEALQSADENVSRSDALKQARQGETACWNKARSKAEYLSLSDDRRAELRAVTRPAVPSPPVADAAALPPGVRESVGPYASAVRVNSGLFSTIFCALPLPGTEPPGAAAAVALKVSHLSSIAPPHDPIREARLLKLARHPSILTALDTINLPQEFVLVTPYLSCNFAEILAKGSVSLPNARSIMSDVFTGLAHVHSLGIIHRDLKPSNILLHSPNGGAVIADFGISWYESDPASEPSTNKITDIGTTHYRAPELLFGFRDYGPEVDLWAAGCVLAEAIDSTHRPLFDSGDLGSELRLVSDIFHKLGTPTLDTWPAARNFPDFGKLNFMDFPRQPWDTLITCADPHAHDLLSKLITYEAADRMAAATALEHEFFWNITCHAS